MVTTLVELRIIKLNSSLHEEYNHLLDVLDGICWLNIEGNGLTGEGLDENLHIYLSNNDYTINFS